MQNYDEDASHYEDELPGVDDVESGSFGASEDAWEREGTIGQASGDVRNNVLQAAGVEMGEAAGYDESLYGNHEHGETFGSADAMNDVEDNELNEFPERNEASQAAGLAMPVEALGIGNSLDADPQTQPKKIAKNCIGSGLAYGGIAAPLYGAISYSAASTLGLPAPLVTVAGVAGGAAAGVVALLGGSAIYGSGMLCNMLGRDEDNPQPLPSGPITFLKGLGSPILLPYYAAKALLK